MFTTITPPESALSLRYMCSVEEGPERGAFTIRVFDPRRNHTQVSSAIVRCPPSALTEAARSHLQNLHPDRGFTLAPFEPSDKWERLITQ